MATTASPDARAIAPAAIAVSVALVCGIALVIAMPRLAGAILPDGTAAATAEAIVDLAIFAPLMLIATIAGRLQRVTVWRAGRAAGASGASGLAVGIAGLAVAALLAWLAGTVARGGGAGAGGLLLVGLLITVVQVAGEEVYVRGWLQPVLSRAAGPLVGAAVAAFVFMLLHLAGGTRSAITLFNIFVAGFLFGLAALRSGGLVAPIALHFGWNAAEQFGLGLDPNPGVGPFGALLDLDMAGAALWGGSGEGLNGSLAVTFVLVALVLPLLAVGTPKAETPADDAAPAGEPVAPRHAWLVGEG